MDTLLMWQALNRALDEEMARDPDVFVLGEDVGLYGGSYRVTEGLYAKYGPHRVLDTPISEGSFTGLGIGAALIGLRPVVEIMTINFSLLALDAIVNMAAKVPFMSGGQFPMPLVVRMPGGVAKQLAAQHAQRLEQMYMNVPGLRIAVPATAQDAYWQLKQAIRSNEPIIFIEHELLYFREGPVDFNAPPPPMHRARIHREGSDLTLITYSRMLEVSLQAADQLAQHGIEATVIDLRSLRPIDYATCLQSIERTHHVLIVEEDSTFAGAGSEIAATLSEKGFYWLDAPPQRVGARELPIPYNGTLEQQCIPQVNDVVTAALKLLNHGGES